MLFYAAEQMKYKTDFYDYLECEENATRYTVPLAFLKEKLGNNFSILDINCLRGAILNHINKDCDYLGLDGSNEAIEYCRNKYKNRSFTNNLDVVCNNKNRERFDVISLSNGYIVRKFRDKNSVQDDTEYVISKLLDSGILKSKGFISVNPHFFYRDHQNYSKFKQADFWLSEVEKRTGYLNKYKLVFSAISDQIGIDNFIRKCKQKPDWFLENSKDDLANNHAGTYISSAHKIYQYYN